MLPSACLLSDFSRMALQEYTCHPSIPGNTWRGVLHPALYPSRVHDGNSCGQVLQVQLALAGRLPTGGSNGRLAERHNAAFENTGEVSGSTVQLSSHTETGQKQLRQADSFP